MDGQIDRQIDWLIYCSWVHVGLELMGPLCPMSNHGSPVTLLKFKTGPKLKLLMSSGSKKKEPRYACLSEPKASHSQRMWAEVSSFTPNLLHNGLSSSPSRCKCRCLLRMLCPVRRPFTALDWVLLNDKSFALVSGLGPEISSRACLWVPSSPHHLAQCWVISQRLSLFLWKARIEAGSEQQHGLVKITPSCVSKGIWPLVVCFLLGNPPAFEFYIPTFWNTVCSIFIGR